MPERDVLQQTSKHKDDSALLNLEVQIAEHKEHDRQESVLGQLLRALWGRPEQLTVESAQRYMDLAKKQAHRNSGRLRAAIADASSFLIEADRQSLTMSDEAAESAAGFIKSTALFIPGKSGFLLSGAAWGVDELRGGQSLDAAAAQMFLGAVKGSLLKASSLSLGKTSLSASWQGIGLGISSRFIDGALSPCSYTDVRTGKSDFLGGLASVWRTSVDREKIASDLFAGITGQAIAGGACRLAPGLIAKVSSLSGVMTGVSFGMSCGAAAEITNEQSSSGQLDVMRICQHAAVQGLQDGLSARLGRAFGLSETSLAGSVHASRARGSEASPSSIESAKEKFDFGAPEVFLPKDVAPAERRLQRARGQLMQAFGQVSDLKTIGGTAEWMTALEKRAAEQGVAARSLACGYREIATLLDTRQSPEQLKLNAVLCQQILKQAAYPYLINQGDYKTCQVAALEFRTYLRNPGQAMHLVAEVARTGNYRCADGDGSPIVIDRQSLLPLPLSEDPYKGEYRSYASQIFQLTAANVFWQRMNRTEDYKWVPRGAIRYEHWAAGPDLCYERLVDYSGSRPHKIDTSPCLSVQNLEEINAHITGRLEYFALGREQTEQSLRAILLERQRAGVLPLVMSVHSGNPPFQTAQAAAAGRKGAWHAIAITHFESGRDHVFVFNPWGWTRQRDGLSLKDLSRATYSPKV